MKINNVKKGILTVVAGLALAGAVKYETTGESDLDLTLEGRVTQNQTTSPNHVSEDGIKLIEGFEGFSSKRYDDIAGNPTIGYGHKMKKDENLKTINREDAEKLLKKDAIYAEREIDRDVKVSLNQNQYDSLVSFTYNVGIGNFEKSTLLKKLNSGDYTGASEEFKRWNKVGGKVVEGLKNRRAKEKELFLKK